jgi:HAD superfamily hydrolase (TIGR01509 family)
MSQVQFVYFDLGNVIVNFSHQQACQQLGDLLGVGPERVWRVMFESDLNSLYDVGELDSNDFHREFSRIIGKTSNRQQFFRAYSQIFELKAAVVSLVVGLRQARIRLGILSNTSPAHWDYLTARYPILGEYFESLILSYQVGACKPAETIYWRAIEAAQAPPEAIFFMDDRPENVAGAASCGIDAVLFTSVAEIRQQLLLRGIMV